MSQRRQRVDKTTGPRLQTQFSKSIGFGGHKQTSLSSSRDVCLAQDAQNPSTNKKISILSSNTPHHHHRLLALRSFMLENGNTQQTMTLLD